MLMDGLHVPLCVPFYRDGAPYFRKLEHNVGRLSLTPASALVALGYASEAEALTDEETAESLRTVAAVAGKDKVLIARIERRSVRQALLVADQAARANFDAVLLGVPASHASLAASERGLLYLRAVADSSPVPVMLWSGDGRVHARLTIEQAAVLATHPNVLGMYDIELTPQRARELAAATAEVQRDVTVTTVFAPVTARMLAASQPSVGAQDFVPAGQLSSAGTALAVAVAQPVPALKIRTRTVGFQVLAAGSALGLPELFAANVPGAMPVLATAAPQAVHEVLAAWKDGDPALAAEKSERLREGDMELARLGVPAVKYACDLNGYYGGAPRLPILPLTAEERTLVETAFSNLKN